MERSRDPAVGHGKEHARRSKHSRRSTSSSNREPEAEFEPDSIPLDPEATPRRKFVRMMLISWLTRMTASRAQVVLPTRGGLVLSRSFIHSHSFSSPHLVFPKHPITANLVGMLMYTSFLDNLTAEIFREDFKKHCGPFTILSNSESFGDCD